MATLPSIEERTYLLLGPERIWILEVSDDVRQECKALDHEGTYGVSDIVLK